MASKAWLLRLSLVPSWLHYPLFQVVQVLPAVFSSVCAPTGLQRHTYGHLTATLSSRYTAQKERSKERSQARCAHQEFQHSGGEGRRTENSKAARATIQSTRAKGREERDQRLVLYHCPPGRTFSAFGASLPLPLHTTPNKGDLEPRTPSFRPCNGSQRLRLWFEFVHTSEVCFLATWAKRSSQNLGIIPGSSLSPIILEIHYEQEGSDTD